MKFKLAWMSKILASVLSVLFLFGVGFVPTNAANPQDEIRDKSGRVIYSRSGDRIYKGRDCILRVTTAQSTPFLTKVESDKFGRFDLIDVAASKGHSYTTSSHSFRIEQFGSKWRVTRDHSTFLEFKSKLQSWKIAVFVYNKLCGEEDAKQEAEAEQKALKDEARAQGLYTGELHEALADSSTPFARIKQMVKSHPEWLGEYDEKHRLPIHIAAFNSNISTDILQFLVDNGADINSPGPHGFTPLYFAMEGESKEHIQWLVKHGALYSGEEGPFADFHNQYWLVKYLFKQGYPVDYENSEGITPFLWALINVPGDDFPDILGMFLKLKPDVTHKDHKGRNAFHLLCCAHELREPFLYGASNVIVDDSDSDDSESDDSCDVLSTLFNLLKSAGVDINAKDNFGRAPLHYISCRDVTYFRYSDWDNANFCWSALLDKMLAMGADINITDNNGRTPLHYAARVCDEFDTDLGADFKVSMRVSPLFRELVRRGANPEIADKDGKKPVDYNPAVADVLNPLGCCTIM